jgi:DNA-binding XRE family transcriptional regulator
MTFIDLITKYRNRSGLNKTDLARKLGVIPAYIMNIEAGRGKLSGKLAEKLIDIFRLSESERKEFLHLWAQLKVSKEILDTLSATKHIEIKEDLIPIVSGVGATDDTGQTYFEPYGPPYKNISFKDCKAVIVESNSMAPIAYKGQKIIYCETEPIHDGDLVFVKFKDGAQLFKRYFKNHGDLITFHGINPVESPRPLIKKPKDVEFCYKVVGIKF